MAPSEGSHYDDYSEKRPAPKFYRRRKYWYICAPVTIAIVLLVVLLILFVGFPKIAQGAINGSSITVHTAQITFPDQTGSVSKRDATDGNSTFILSMDSTLSNTGPFSATITFDEISVYFNDSIKVWFAIIGSAKKKIELDTLTNMINHSFHIFPLMNSLVLSTYLQHLFLDQKAH